MELMACAIFDKWLIDVHFLNQNSQHFSRNGAEAKECATKVKPFKPNETNKMFLSKPVKF